MKEDQGKIAAALVAAQKAFGPALKTSSNPHFKSRYADLAACVEAVIEGLNASGIMLMQRTHDCESGVKVETVFLHESGESLSAGTLHVPASKQDAQGYGSALTYARRYSLMAACGIAPEDDDGNAASKKPAKQQVDPQAQSKMLETLREASMQGSIKLAEVFQSIPNTPAKALLWGEHGPSLKAAAKEADGGANPFGQAESDTAKHAKNAKAMLQQAMESAPEGGEA